MSEAELKELITKRGIVRGKLTRFEKYLDEQPSDLNEVQVRLDRYTDLLDDFEQHQNIIESLVANDELSLQVEIRAKFESQYFSVISRSKQMLAPQTAEFASGSSSHNSVAARSYTRSNVQLPRLELPSFSGSLDEYLCFRDTFEAIINKNPDLPDIEKYYYLRSSLKGDALKVIASLEVSNANYKVAWDLLKDRFENKTLLIHNHIKALFNINQSYKESHVSLRYILDTLNKNIRALKTLNQPTEHWDALVIYLISTKLPEVTRQQWETINKSESPKLDDFKAFLSDRSQLLEKIDSTQNPVTNKFHSKSNTTLNNSQKLTSKQYHSFMTTKSNCLICNQSHNIYQCKTLLDMQTTDKYTTLNKLNICTNCLKVGHNYRICRSSKCRKCGRKHNTILCNNSPKAAFTQNANTNIPNAQINTNNENAPTNTDTTVSSRFEQSTSNQNITQDKTFSATSAHKTQKQECHVILSTAIVYVVDKFGNYLEARALLDSASQSNFITKELSDKLSLTQDKVNYTVTGLNQSTTNTTFMINTNIKSRIGNFTSNVSCLILKEITPRLPQVLLDVTRMNIPKNIILADPEFQRPSKVDMLLGASIFWDLLGTNQIKLSKNSPTLQETKLGYVVSGTFTQPTNINSLVCLLSNNQLHKQLEKFWQLEDCVNKSHPYSSEDEACENHFKETHLREADGRFQVALPFRRSKDQLGSSKEAALKRLTCMERKFDKQPDLKRQYSEFMQEYIDLQHMEVVSNNENSNELVHYLPHHAVFKDSTTTRLRCVFDGSHKTVSGIALNDILMVGPVVQRDLFSILLAFRQHAYVITADITKMYRQINVKPEDTDLQRILWRFSKELPVQEYRLKTVTYGLGPSAFLATRCLKQLSIEYQEKYPKAADAIQNCFYVDDLLCGTESVQEAIKLKADITHILNQGQFHLHKWRSNDPSIISNNKSNLVHIGDTRVDSKTLGISWHSEKDVFIYNFQGNCMQPAVVTKRIILSIIAQIYDPLGLLGPITIKAKVFIQSLWKKGLDWDQPFPHELAMQWKQFQSQLKTINQLSFPRYIACHNFIHLQLHGFSDASEMAYGAVIYLRATNSQNKHFISLVCSKTKVAPLKTQSIPRLELCAALLLANLYHTTIQSLKLPIGNVFLWSDSTIALTWISGDPYNWKTFISNRVSKIQGLTYKESWRHVRTENNPADLLSRGATPEQLANSNFWHQGPEWLTQDEQDWPEPKHIQVHDVPERRKEKQTFHATINQDFSIFTRFSSFVKLQRVIAYMLRFKSNALKTTSTSGPLTATELQAASNLLIKLAQQQSFAEEIDLLEANKPLKSKCKLISLNPFIDKTHMLRVGGRLKHSNIAFTQKHPLILPNHHPLTDLIIMHFHKRGLHAGQQALLATIRLQFWPISAKNNIKRVLKGCIICFRCNPYSVERIMGQLPANRTIPARPFTNCGLDYAGPFTIKMTNTKTRTFYKAYLCIFVCFATKATHLELVSDLTSTSFLNTLKRFISRRGLISNIYSDNGTTFVGANHELTLMYNFLVNQKSQISEYLSSQYINWHFIPARSPHMGGLWEAAVKSAKFHLKRVVGSQILNYEELCTIICQVEACLNSRPLCQISNDPNDLTSLTPGHFLIGSSLQSFPETDHTELKINRLTRYQLLTQITQDFWRRWSKEYLMELQNRYKWQKGDTRDLQVGTLVILKEDNYHPLFWHMGRVMELHPGSDGIVRVVTVKTKSGLFKRAVTKVCPLPIN